MNLIPNDRKSHAVIPFSGIEIAFKTSIDNELHIIDVCCAPDLVFLFRVAVSDTR